MVNPQFSKLGEVDGPVSPNNQVTECMFIVGGNAMISSDSIGAITRFLEKYPDANRNQAFFFADLPGYNSNAGKPSPPSALLAHTAAIRQLKQIFRSNDLKFNFLGHSLGSAVVLQTAAHPDVNTNRVIVSAPFQDTVLMAQTIFPSMPYTMLNAAVHHKWNNTASVSKLNRNVKLTIIHSQADAIVPYAQGNRLKMVARQHGVRTKFVTFTWGGHNEIFQQHFQHLESALADQSPGQWSDENLLNPNSDGMLPKKKNPRRNKAGRPRKRNV